MSARSLTSLPVIMPVVTEQRWSCHSCGNCCRSLTGHLTEADRRRIDEFNWAAELGVVPYVALGRGFVLNKTAEDVCVFLDEHNRCRIHSRFGEEAKPVACRIFPFSMRRLTRGWQASLRFDCPSVASSKGQSISEYRRWLSELASEMPDEVPGDDRAELQRGIIATTDEIDALLARLEQWIGGDEQSKDLSFRDRLLGAAHMTSMLTSAKFEKVRGERFAELLDIIVENLPSELGPDEADIHDSTRHEGTKAPKHEDHQSRDRKGAETHEEDYQLNRIPNDGDSDQCRDREGASLEVEIVPSEMGLASPFKPGMSCEPPQADSSSSRPGLGPALPPSPRQRALLRQLVFAHTEHVTVAEARAGFAGRTRKKLSQLLAARRMRTGRGVVPRLRSFETQRQPTFDEVELMPFRIQSFEIDRTRERFDAAESEICATENAEKRPIDELLQRYVLARLEGRTVFGAGYYGWPIFTGLSALWLSLVAVGWLARYAAAGHGRKSVAFDDAAAALAFVDRAATRMPSIGTASERLRVAYLLRDDGICRLLRAYL